MRTASGVFAARSLLQNQNGCFSGSRLISSKRVELPEPSTSETNKFEPLSAARCRVFRRSHNKVHFLIQYLCAIFYSTCKYCDMVFGEPKTTYG